MPTPWTSLRSVVRLDFLNDYAISLCHMFKAMSEEPIWDAIGFPSALFTPFTLTFSEVPEPFYGDISVELFSEFDDFVRYLPHPRSNIVSLSSAESFELEPSFASRNRVSILLKLRSSLLEPKLFGGNILSKVGLLQHLISADYGYSDFGAVYVYTHPVLSYDGFRHLLREDGEEPEISSHDDAHYLPSVSKVFLKPLVSSVLADGKPYPLVVYTEAEDRITSLGLLEAEEPTVKANHTLVQIAVCSFSDAPSIAGCLYNELGSYMVLVHEQSIGGFVELPPAPNAVRSFEGFLHDAKEGLIRFSKKSFLSFCRFKDVENETLLHVADPKKKYILSFK